MNLLKGISARRRFRILLRGISLVIGFIAAYIATILISENKYVWAIIPSLFVLIASFCEFVLGDIITEERFPARTEKILTALEERILTIQKNLSEELTLVKNSLNGCDIDKVSITLHLKVNIYSSLDDRSEDAFVQVMDYLGRCGGRRWRFVSSTKGIIGRCLRTGTPEVVNFANEVEYRKRMVAEFGFTQEEANKITKEARSYFAHPVFSQDELVGVIYLFSTEPQVFPKAVSVTYLDGIARHIANLLEAARII